MNILRTSNCNSYNPEFIHFDFQVQNGHSTVTLRKSGMTAKSNVALRMSSIHVTTFVACWTPYLVISLWHIIDENSVQKVSPMVQDILFLTAVLNSCINPFVYGGFYFKNFRKQILSERGGPLTVMSSRRSTNIQMHSIRRSPNNRNRGNHPEEDIIEEAEVWKCDTIIEIRPLDLINVETTEKDIYFQRLAITLLFWEIKLY